MRKLLASHLGDEHGRFPPELAPVMDWLANDPRQKNWWFSSIPNVLAEYVRSCTRSEQAFSIDDFLALVPYTTARRWIDAFCATGLLPLSEVAVTRVRATYRRDFAHSMHPDDDRLVRQYLNHDFLPWLRARRVAHASTSISLDSNHIASVARFLQRLRERHVTVASCTLADLDATITGSQPKAIRRFIIWAGRTYPQFRALRRHAPPRSETPLAPSNVLARHIRRLSDNQYPLSLRLAAALIVVFGQRSVDIALLRRENLIATPGGLQILLAKTPITLPQALVPLATWGVGGNPRAWLFPDRRYAQEPMSTQSLQIQLRRSGLIDTSITLLRSTAIARFLETAPIWLAVDALGVSRQTAAFLRKLVASPSYAHYVGLRIAEGI